jgi:two-component system sensor histidine kinase VicK
MADTTFDHTATLSFLQGGGTMGQLMRSKNWAATSVGDPEKWPPSLKNTIGLALSSLFPMLICWGPDYIQFYNDAYRPILGAGKLPDALGNSSRNSFAEAWDIIGPMFSRVWEGESIAIADFMVPLNRNGYEEECYFDFSYSPIRDQDGTIRGILVVCTETTARIASLKRYETANKEIELARAETEVERDRLENFFMQSPAGICVLNGPHLVFELINPLYQQLFPGRKLLGKRLLDALPEIKDQPIYNILYTVYKTGQTYKGKELLVPLAKGEGQPVENRYFNFIYQARKDVSGRIDGILVFVFEVTDMVKARKEREQAQDLLQMAIDTAGIGIWTVDVASGNLTLSPQSRLIHGIPERMELTLSESLAMITDEYRNHVMDSINQAVQSQTSFSAEYWINPMDGGKPRWLHSNGRAYYDEDGKPQYITGTITDLTEQKEDENRKNDFIGMVSHELKTPLTSLKAYIQVLAAKALKGGESVENDILVKADQQAKKMTTMINGFLNISRLESGKLSIDKQRFDIDNLLQEVIADIQLTVKTHNLQYEPCGPVNVNADRDKIGSVLNNLLTNAVKYSPKGKLINLKCNLHSDTVQISVSDEGMGIKEQDLPHLFNRYYRVESRHTAHISGFGIGLYLSAEIIWGHQGSIWAESEIGHGSTFNFTLPLA